MTEIGFVIQPGEAIPDDVAEVRDKVNDGWKLFDDGWRLVFFQGAPCEDTSAGLASDILVVRWAPLTVTAVRPQPAEPHEIVATHCGNQNCVHEPHQWMGMDDAGDKVVIRRCSGTGPVAEDVPTFDVAEIFPEVVAAESVDLLDLVRQYGDQRERFISCVGCNTLDESRSHEQAGHALLARIEAEVNRLRDDRQKLREAAIRHDELLADRDSARTELRRQASEWIAEAEVRAESNRQLVEALGVKELTDVMPAIKALKAAAATASDPLVLSLPSVPDGATALVFEQASGDIRFTRVEGALPWRMVDDAGEAHYWALIDILVHYGPVRVVMREPRTWPKLDAEVSRDELPDRVEVDGSSYRRAGDFSYLHEKTGGLWDWWSLRGRGEVVEVFDEDGADR